MDEYAKYYMPGEKVGVLGIPVPDRSVMDQRDKIFYNSCNTPDLTFAKKGWREGFVKLSDLGSRSARDLQLQAQYNPMVKEGYCSSNNDTFPAIAKTTDNPYNPYSGKIQFRYT